MKNALLSTSIVLETQRNWDCPASEQNLVHRNISVLHCVVLFPVVLLSSYQKSLYIILNSSVKQSSFPIWYRYKCTVQWPFSHSVLHNGHHCLNVSVFTGVSADQSGWSRGGRCAVRDNDCDEGQQPHPSGHGLLAGQELSLCHVQQSGKETSSFCRGCQENCWGLGWCGNYYCRSSTPLKSSSCHANVALSEMLYV